MSTFINKISHLDLMDDEKKIPVEWKDGLDVDFL